jgi:glycerophosphoryl diester phosphodiesterase
LLECPELVSLIKSYGLLVVTWGDKNNIVECVKKQQDMGVDAVIIDHIAHVRKGLVQQQ